MSYSPLGEALISVIAVIVLLYPVAGLVGTAFLWRVYRSDPDRPRSWILFRLAVGSTLVAIASLGAAWLAFRRLTGGDALAEGPYVLGVVVVVLESVPVWYAYSIWRIQRIHVKNHGTELSETPHGHVASDQRVELQMTDGSGTNSQRE